MTDSTETVKMFRVGRILVHGTILKITAREPPRIVFKTVSKVSTVLRRTFAGQSKSDSCSNQPLV